MERNEGKRGSKAMPMFSRLVRPSLHLQVEPKPGSGWNVGRKEEELAGEGKGRTPAAVSKAEDAL